MSSDDEGQISNSSKNQKNFRNVLSFNRHLKLNNYQSDNVVSNNGNDYCEKKHFNRSRSSILPHNFYLPKTLHNQSHHRRKRHQNGSMLQCKNQFCYNNNYQYCSHQRQIASSRQSLSPSVRRSPVNRLKEKSADKKRISLSQYNINSSIEKKMQYFDNRLVAVKKKKIYPLYYNLNNTKNENINNFENFQQNAYYHREDSLSSSSCTSCSKNLSINSIFQTVIKKNVSFIFNYKLNNLLVYIKTNYALKILMYV